MKRLLLVTALLIALLLPINILAVSANGSVTFYPCPDELPITIRYHHSVVRGDVIEVLEAGSSGLHLLETRWQGLGAGLPQDFTFTEDGYYVQYVDEYLGRSLEYRFIPLNNAEVTVGNCDLLLQRDSDLRIVFTVEEMPVIEFLIRRVASAIP